MGGTLFGQKLIYDILEKDLNGRGTSKQIEEKIREKYPGEKIVDYIPNRLQKLSKWGYIKRERNIYIIIKKWEEEQGNDESKGEPIHYRNCLQWFFTSSQNTMKILDVLVEEPEQFYTLPELAVEARVSTKVVGTIIPRLKELELVREEEKDDKMQYAFNGDSELGLALATFVSILEETQKQKA